MIMLLAIAATVAGQSPVDRVMSICEEDLARFSAEWKSADAADEQFSDAVVRTLKGDRSLMIRVKQRDDAYDARSMSLRRSAALGASLNERQIAEMESICGRMRLSWLEGMRAALENAVVVTNAP